LKFNGNVKIICTDDTAKLIGVWNDHVLY